jgi:hypothetical protein
VEIQRHLTALRIDEWLREDLFHFKWWLLLALIIASLLVWWIALDKSRLREVLLYAGLTALTAMGIDEYGEELILWDFPIDIIPIFPVLSSLSLVWLPLVYSLIYQRFRNWKSFIVSTVIITALFCFVIEPALAWGGFYQLIRWKYYYSFPIYSLAAIGIRALVIRIRTITVASRNEGPTRIKPVPPSGRRIRLRPVFTRKPLR